MARVLFLSDLELTESKIDDARLVFDDLKSRTKSNQYESLIFAGDLFEDFTPETVQAARELIDFQNCNQKIILVGNHDYAAGTVDKITGAFSGMRRVSVIDKPTFQYVNGQGFAFLPAPNVKSFGASKRTLTKKELNIELTNALGNALKFLKNQCQPAKTILVCHGTVEGAVFRSGRKSTGLTWQLPATELKQWRAVFAGHLHHPFEMGIDAGASRIVPVYGIGSIMPWNFGEPDIVHQAMEMNAGAGTIHSLGTIPLYTPKYMVEYYIDTKRVHVPEYGMEQLFDESQPRANQFIDMITSDLFERGEWIDGKGGVGKLWIKLRFQLPNHMMGEIPDKEMITSMIHQETPWKVGRISIVKERTTEREIRLDTSGGFELRNYFEQWRNLNGIHFDETTKDYIEQIVDSYQTAIKPAGNFSYVPVSLKATNAFQWENLKIDFRDWNKIVAITGKNARGKSNIIEIIEFALFKKSPTAKTLDMFINDHSDKATVEHVFESGGARYRIRHGLKRRKAGAECNTTLDCFNGEKWESVADNAGAVKNMMESLVSSYDFFTATVIGNQGDIGRIKNATSTDWLDLILESRALNSFNQMKSEQKDYYAKLETDKADLQRQIENCNDNIAEIREFLDKNKSEDSDTISAVEKALVKLKETRDQKRELKKITNKHLLEQERQLQKLEQARNEKRTLELTISELKKKCERPDEPEKPDVLIDDLNDERKQIQAAVSEHESKLVDIRETVRHLNDKLESVKSEIVRIESRIVTDQKNADLMKQKQDDLDVPCEDVEWNDAVVKYDCPAWKIVTDAETITALQQKIAENNTELIRLRQIKKETSTELKKAESGHASIKYEYQVCKDQLKNVDARLVDANKKLQVWRDWNDLMERIDIREKELDDRRERLAENEKIIDEFADVDLDGVVEQGESEIKRINSALDEIDKDIDLVQDKLARIKSNADKIADYESRLKKQESKKAELKGKVDELTPEINARKLLARAFDRKDGGIPYLIIEYSIDSIETVANDILKESGIDITVEFETISQTRTGELRDQVNVYFNDDNGRHLLPALSGYQEAVVGMAIRAAMAITGSDFWGVPPQLYVQDEGWDRFHSDVYPLAMNLIRSIQDKISTFIFITHIIELAVVANKHVMVKRNEFDRPVLVTGE